jgi:uncharacterized protein YukE
MSNYIYVNHSQFEKTAAAIENYLSKQNKNMDAAGKEIETLALEWQGKDSEIFQNQWNKVNENHSTSKKMAAALENYVQFLRFTANLYKKAQAEAVNKANKLF